MSDNQKANLRIGLLPLVVIIGLILGAGYLLLAGEINLPKFGNKSVFRRLEGFPTVLYTKQTYDKGRVVIKSEEELNNFLNKVDPSGLLQLKEKINFNKEYLVAVNSNSQENVGRTIRIKKIAEDKTNNVMLVSIDETEKDEKCIVEKDNNIGVDIVAVTKTDKAFEFDRKKSIEACKESELNTTNETSSPTGETNTGTTGQTNNN